MEHLTKQQIILVTLLVSFVTSIATGIVTVTLMDQAPQSVTHTINRVVEKTVERVIPAEIPVTPAQVREVIVTGEEILAKSADKNQKTIVYIERTGRGLPGEGLRTGAGILIGRNTILADSTSVNLPGNYRVLLPDGLKVSIAVPNPSQLSAPTTTLTINASTSPLVSANMSPTTYKIGQTVYTFDTTGRLVTGLIENITITSTTTIPNIQTSLPVSRISLGSPLFALTGELIGIRLLDNEMAGQGSFTPVRQ